MFCVFVVLWGFGWRAWFAVAGAAVIAWLIAYSMFGSMHDAAAKQMESWVSRRFVGARGDEVAEDAELGDAEAETRTEAKAVAKSTAKATPKSMPKATTKATPKAGSASEPRRPR